MAELEGIKTRHPVIYTKIPNEHRVFQPPETALYCIFSGTQMPVPLSRSHPGDGQRQTSIAAEEHNRGQGLVNHGHKVCLDLLPQRL